MVDPVGPRVFPLVAVGLLLIGAAWMMLRPAPDSGPYPSLHIALTILALAAVPILIPWLGFVVTVGGAMGAVALLMGGRAVASGIAAIAIAAALFLVFVYLLGVPLPVGRLFLLEG
jgi:putative tricarboxylic transport membrane protein